MLITSDLLIAVSICCSLEKKTGAFFYVGTQILNKHEQKLSQNVLVDIPVP
jgi:hypothetical protein